MAGRGKVYISHAREDVARCRPLLALFATWGMDYWFEDQVSAAPDQLSGQAQGALAQSVVFLRVCTPAIARSYWMDLELGAFLSLQADDQRLGRSGLRTLVNLILDPGYTPQPFDYAGALIDAAHKPQPIWVNELREALDLPPLETAGSVGVDTSQRSYVSRRRVLGIGAGAATLAIAGGTGLLLLSRAGSQTTVGGGTSTPTPSPTPQSTATPAPATSDPNLAWVYKTGDKITSSPAVANGVVYFGSWDQNFYALDAKSGKVIWSDNSDAKLVNSPFVANGVVYFRAQASLIGLDAVSGKQVFGFLSGASAGPVVVKDMIYAGELGTGLTGGKGSLDGFSAKSKDFVWVGEAPSSVLSLAIVSGVGYAGAETGDVLAFDLSNADPNLDRANTGAPVNKGRMIWSKPFKAGGAMRSNPAVAGGTLYLGSDDGYLYALDAAHGRLRWRFKTGDKIQTDPTVAGGVVVFGSLDGNIYGLDTISGRQRWKIATGDTVLSSPTYVGGLFYIGAADGLIRGIQPNGTVAKSFRAGGPVDSRPSVANGILYVGSLDGFMYAFNL